MKFIYTRIKDEIRIDQIEDPEVVIYVPEQFEDCPVTELGSYVLAHSAVEEIHLPPYVRKIGAYGFYECEQLKRIYCYSRVLDLVPVCLRGFRPRSIWILQSFRGSAPA